MLEGGGFFKLEHQRASDNVIMHNNSHHLTALAACSLCHGELGRFVRPSRYNWVAELLGVNNGCGNAKFPQIVIMNQKMLAEGLVLQRFRALDSSVTKLATISLKLTFLRPSTKLFLFGVHSSPGLACNNWMDSNSVLRHPQKFFMGNCVHCLWNSTCGVNRSDIGIN